jgi:AraC-like DNA-binding protein
MMKEYEEKKTGYISMLRASMLDLCVRMHRAEESLHSQEIWNGMLKGLNQVKPALDFVDIHYREPIGLKDISVILSLSESRARHLFKASVGKGFKQYLAFVRIQEAKRLLTMTDLSATEVFLACGFQSAAPFYRSFQQLVGLSPLQYRHRLEYQK